MFVLVRPSDCTDNNNGLVRVTGLRTVCSATAPLPLLVVGMLKKDRQLGTTKNALAQ